MFKQRQRRRNSLCPAFSMAWRAICWMTLKHCFAAVSAFSLDLELSWPPVSATAAVSVTWGHFQQRIWVIIGDRMFGMPVCPPSQCLLYNSQVRKRVKDKVNKYKKQPLIPNRLWRCALLPLTHLALGAVALLWKIKKTLYPTCHMLCDSQHKHTWGVKGEFWYF